MHVLNGGLQKWDQVARLGWLGLVATEQILFLPLGTEDCSIFAEVFPSSLGRRWFYASLLPELFTCLPLPSLQELEQQSFIHTKGCAGQFEKWLQDNLIVVAGTFVGVALLQVYKLLLLL